MFRHRVLVGLSPQMEYLVGPEGVIKMGRGIGLILTWENGILDTRTGLGIGKTSKMGIGSIFCNYDQSRIT